MRAEAVRAPTRRKLALLTGAALLVIGAGVGQVQRRHESVRLGYELSRADAELRALEEEDRRLRLEISVLTNPERIESLARAMGMERPRLYQIRSAAPGPLAAAKGRP